MIKKNKRNHLSFPNLQIFSLYPNRITNKGFSYLVSLELPQILMIDFSSNRLTNDAAKPLLKSLWPTLEKLLVIENSMNDEMLKMGWKMFPPCLKQLAVCTWQPFHFYSNFKPTSSGFAHLSKRESRIEVKVGKRSLNPPFQRIVLSRQVMRMIRSRANIKFIRGRDQDVLAHLKFDEQLFV